MPADGPGKANPIAVIGVGCRFAGGISEPSDLWKCLEEQRSVTAALPVSRFPGAPPNLYGGFIEGAHRFDAAFFGMSPREATATDPQHRLLLEVAWDAVENAGIDPTTLNGVNGCVYMGLNSSDHQAVQRGKAGSRDVYSILGSARNAAAGRISHALGMRGASAVVDSDRSSSLLAIHMACAALRSGQARIALAGGANLIFDLETTLAFAASGLLSVDGQCKFGDASADGFARSEGIGVVVLKPLADALADGDPIRCVIRGSAVNHTGSRSPDLMTPNQDAQQDLLTQAFADADVSAASLQYIEAHGPGTPVGDPIELAALQKVVASARSAHDGPCFVGSVKTNLGHCEAAAGIAGVIKTCLALEHRRIPATLHLKRVNPAIIETDALRFAKDSLDWPQSHGPARAGVSSFGFSGTSVHVVLESAPQRHATQAGEGSGPWLLPLSARSEVGVLQLSKAWFDWLSGARMSDVSLQSICSAAARNKAHHPHRVAVVVGDRQAAIEALRHVSEGVADNRVVVTPANATPGKLAFTFSGQGSQWPRMGYDLLEKETEFAQTLRECDSALRRHVSWSLFEQLAAPTDEGWTVDVIQPMLFCMSVALTDLWKAYGVVPDAVVGTSMGEVAAAHVAGILSLDDALRIICVRSQLARQESGKGSMLVVGLSREDAHALIADYPGVSVAVSNSPASCVVSGVTREVEQVAELLTKREIYNRLVRVDFASHSPLMDPLREPLLSRLHGIQPRAAKIPMFSTVTNKWLSGLEMDAAYWVENLRQPVLFGDALTHLIEQGTNTFIEASPHPLHTDAVIDNAQQARLHASHIGSLVRGADGASNVASALGKLYCGGRNPAWTRLYPGSKQRVELPRYPWDRQAFGDDTAAPPLALSNETAPASAPPPQAAPPRSSNPTAFAERLGKAPTAQRIDMLQQYIRMTVARVLGIANPEELDPERPFRELGLKSMMEAELRTLLGDALGQGLPGGLTYSHPTIARLAKHLSGADFPGKSQRRASQTRMSEPVAIVGMACRFPGGINGTSAFWELLAQGADAIGELPTGRLDRVEREHFGERYPKRAGFVKDIDQFDAAFFHISPREAERMDPQQRLALEVAWEAFEDAGQTQGGLSGSRTGVFLGIMNYNEYATLKRLRHLEQEPHDSTGEANSAAAGRLAYTLGLQGPCMAVDTACSSSLVALHLAVTSLRVGECRMALVGGVNLVLTPEHSVAFSASGMLSPDGLCRTFDAAANGYVRSEGCAFVVIKRLSDAQNDGDAILGTLRGTAINQDGASNGLTAPSGAAQVSLIREALASADVAPWQVDYVEAHGTGTPLGDPVEVNALQEAFGNDVRKIPLVLGAVKANVGHMEAAAGMAGLIKVLLMMQHRTVPPQPHFHRLNPEIIAPPAVLRVADHTAVPWTGQAKQRLAGISSFGFSGTNAHVIVQEADAGPSTAVARKEAQLPAAAQTLILSGHTREALAAQRARYTNYLSHFDDADLPSLAYTLSHRRTHFNHRLAVVGADCKALQEQLAEARAKDVPRGRKNRLAFVFSGHGSQWVGMGKQLAMEDPVFAASLRACDEAIRVAGGFSILQLLDSATVEAPVERVEWVQPCLFAIQVSLAHAWRALGIVPETIVGHSMGEVAAAHIAGALSLEDAALVVCLRSKLMARVAGHGAMLLVDATLQETLALIEPWGNHLSIAVENTPHSHVVSGDAAAVDELRLALEAKKRFVGRVKTDVAFHSSHMDTLDAELAAGLQGMTPKVPNVRLYSTVTAKTVDGADTTADYWGSNLRQRVLLAPVLDALMGEGYDTIVEVSPHPVLQQVIASHWRDSGHHDACVEGSMRRDDGGMQGMLKHRAALWTGGYPVDFRDHQTADAKVLRGLPTIAWQHQRHWLAARETDTTSRVERVHAHPLIGIPARAPLTAAAWDHDIDLRTVSYLADHKVGGAIVMPGAGYTEMFLTIGECALGQRVDLTDVQFHAMLTLSEETPVQLRFAVEKGTGAESTTAQLEVSTTSSGGKVVHASARAHVSQDTPNPTASLPLPASDAMVHSAIYATLAQMGLGYGPEFQALLTASFGEHETAQGRLDNVTLDSSYTLSPNVLDAALQLAVMQAVRTRTPRTGGTYVPVRFGRVRLFDAAENITAARVVTDDLPVSVPWRGTVVLLNADGAAVGELRDVQLAEMAVTATQTSADAILSGLAQQWQLLEPTPVAEERPDAEAWLLLAPQSGDAGVGLQKALLAQGAKADLIVLGPHWRASMDEAVATRTYTGVVHLGYLNDTCIGDDFDVVARIQKLGLYSAVEVLQALTGRNDRTLPKVWFVTSGAQSLRADDPVRSPWQAGIWGFARALRHEYPNLRQACVDLGADGDTSGVEVTASLATELLRDNAEDEILLRQGLRYGGRLVPAPALATDASRAMGEALHRDATYIITGGLGGLGLHVAQWMASHGAGVVVLLSRRVPTEGFTAARERMVAAGCRVETLALDIADLKQVQALLPPLLAQLPPLRGVIHAAGVLADGLLATQTSEQFDKVMAPKVLGAVVLETVVGALPFDFFVLYSSAVAVLGAAGQTNYAAANACLDALASYRRGRGLPGVSIQWGPFSEAGMAASSEQYGQRMAARGLNSIKPDEGLDVLDKAMYGLSPKVPYFPLRSRHWVAHHPYVADTRLFAEVSVAKAFEDSDDAALVPYLRAEGRAKLSPELWALLSRMDGERRQAPHQVTKKSVFADTPLSRQRQLLQEILLKTTARLLHLSVDKIDEEQALQHLGMDSFMSVELRNQLEGELGLRLPASLVIANPTVKGLFVFLSKELGLQDAPSVTPAQDLVATAPEPLVQDAGTVEALDDTDVVARLRLRLAKRPTGDT